MSTTNYARAGVADNAARNAAVARAFGVMVQLPSASFADRVCRTLETGDNRFVRIGDAPAPHVGDVALVCFEVHRYVTGLLVEPSAHEGGEKARVRRRHREVIGAGHARGVEHDLGGCGHRQRETDQHQADTATCHGIAYQLRTKPTIGAPRMLSTSW